MNLPELSRDEFALKLREASGCDLPGAPVERLFAHYQELRRWAPKVDLIGPGAVPELFARHYAEALAALPWLPREPFRLLDVGSGAGFPGFVLAAARPDAEAWLVEPRQRRAAFLAAAVRRSGLGARVLAARVSPESAAQLPDQVQVVTLRALRLDPPLVSALSPRLADGASILVWTGREEPRLPGGFEVARTFHLTGSRERMVREYRWRGASA